jgi:hypothetical protein
MESAEQAVQSQQPTEASTGEPQQSAPPDEPQRPLYKSVDERAPESPVQAAEEEQQAAQEDPKQDQPTSFTELSRREREIWQRERRLKEAEKQLASQREITEIAKINPLEAAKRLGIDPMRLVNDVLGLEPKEEQKAPDPMSELEAVKKELNEFKASVQEQRYKYVESATKGEFASMIKSNAEKYEILNHALQSGNGILDTVYEAVKLEYEQTGKIPDYHDVLSRAEEVMYEEIYSDLDKYSKLSKIKNRMAPQNRPEPAISAPKPTATLSNKMQGEPVAASVRNMTEQEREDEFRKILRGEIKIPK